MKKHSIFWGLLHCKRGFFTFQFRSRNLFSINLNLYTVHIKPIWKIGNFTVLVKYYQSVPFIRNLFNQPKHSHSNYTESTWQNLYIEPIILQIKKPRYLARGYPWLFCKHYSYLFINLHLVEAPGLEALIEYKT